MISLKHLAKEIQPDAFVYILKLYFKLYFKVIFYIIF